MKAENNKKSEDFSMDSRFDHKEAEARLYAVWEDSKYFNPDHLPARNQEGDIFTIVLPPPNVTGTLHMGSACMLSIEDVMIRYHRMKGDKTLWVPGTDHAAIATQEKVERMIFKAEGKTRHDLGREEFLERVNKFAQDSHDTIVNQVRRMGSSIDWSREAYTLDEERNYAVRTAFKRMYDAGLIYEGDRIVNWDPKMQSTVSDDEVDWEEETIPFYYLKYGPFIIGTARPETKFGDKYVVMHPDDRRYTHYKHGDKITLPWISGDVVATVIKDEAIDMSFGTGVMTITPWHDLTDFEIAERHGLDKEQIIDLHGKLLPIAGEFSGMHISKARKLLVEKMKERGLVSRIDEKYTHRVAKNSRGGGQIEPQILHQWFVDVNKEFELPHSKISGIKSGDKTTLKGILIQVVKSGQIKILPERFEKTYFSWVDNLRDWCISRQIWFGHQVPIWRRQKSQTDGQESGYSEVEIFCGVEAPEGEGWKQDEDTLDTWFSSGLWTFSTLGWPQREKTAVKGKSGKENDFANYCPTSVLETAYDIIFFWVARMILMTGFLLHDIPFHTVYLHGLVRDAQGRKMSKSLDNIIDPVTLIDKYGADATRLSLIIGSAPGNDLKLSEDRVRGYRNFTTKVWNAARFVLSNHESSSAALRDVLSRQRIMEYASSSAHTRPAVESCDSREMAIELTESDEKNLEELRELKKSVTKYIEAYDLNHAADAIYHYFWHTFADKIIEASKARLSEAAEVQDRTAALYVLITILVECLKMLHPFMPYVTEEIWSMVPREYKRETLLIVEPW